VDGWVGPPQGLDSLFFPTILAPLYYYRYGNGPDASTSTVCGS